jgi:hypothetical protein
LFVERSSPRLDDEVVSDLRCRRCTYLYAESRKRRAKLSKSASFTSDTAETVRFPFRCDVFCGSGHEDMSGKLVVTD